MHYKIGEVYVRLLGTNGFHTKARNDTFTAASSRCGHKPKFEIGPHLKTLHQKASLMNCTFLFPHSTNKGIDLRRCRSLPLSFLKLSIQSEQGTICPYLAANTKLNWRRIKEVRKKNTKIRNFGVKRADKDYITSATRLQSSRFER